MFKKLGFTIQKKEIEDVVNCVPDTVERILNALNQGVRLNSNMFRLVVIKKGRRRKLRNRVCTNNIQGMQGMWINNMINSNISSAIKKTAKFLEATKDLRVFKWIREN